MGKAMIVTIIAIVGVIVILGLAYYFYKKQQPKEGYFRKNPNKRITIKPKTTESFSSCDTAACNKYLYDNIVTNDRSFYTNDGTPCKGCYPHFKYAWVPQYGRAYDTGTGWTTCGTKEQCYEKLKR